MSVVGVNLDSASGLPLRPGARKVLEQALDQGWADPLRLHREARQARLLLDNAREVLAEVLGCRRDEVGLTSSGTMACVAGVLGMRRGRHRVGATVLHSAVEHSAVINASRWDADASGLSPAGYSSAGPEPGRPVPDGEPAAVVLAVDSTGQVDLDGLSREVSRRGVAVACVQAANHEVGTVQPLEAVHERCAASDVPLLVDGAAAIGWVPPPRRWDVLAASAHKWGGPAGVGVLAVRRSARWRAPWPTDERERVQPGFVNVPSVLAAAAALQEAESAREQQAARHAAMTDRLRRDLLAAVPDVDVAGHPTQRLGHILSFSCLYVDGEALVTELDKAGFAVASGSACTASALEPSHVLVAMGVLTHGNVRVSLTPETTEADLTAFVEATAEIVRRLRGSTGMGR